MKQIFLLLAVISASVLASNRVQIINGNNIYTNGKCIYVDGEIYEDDQKRPATKEEINEVQQWQNQMANWGNTFAQYMHEKMSNLFTPNYVAPPEPKMPGQLCLCDQQYCDANSVNKKTQH